MAAMKPGAVNVGRNDLASGVAFVKELGKSSGLPWLSSNIRLPDGSAPFPTFKRLKWGELTVVVVAATPANPELDREAGVTVLEPIAALRAALAEAGDADIVIALSDLGYSEEHTLARAVTQLDIIIGGGNGNKLIKDPLRLGKTLLLRVADRGRQLGVFNLDVSKPFAWGRPTTSTGTATSSDALELFGQQLAQARSATPAKDDPVLKTIQALSKKAAKKTTPSGGVRYSNTIVFLNAAIASDPTVAKEIAAFKQQARAATPRPKASTATTGGRKAVAAAPAVSKKIVVAPSPPKAVASAAKAGARRTANALPTNPAPAKKPAPTSTPKMAPKTAPKTAEKTSWYLGTMGCRSCHQPQYAKWLVTGHSRSGSLLPIDKMADPKCRSCHTAKLKLERGSSSEGFVGCESCHGQGSGHPEKMTKKGTKKGKKTATTGKPMIVRKVADGTCLACHRGEHNEIFVLEQDYQKVRCDR